ncbi:ATP-binding protein [Faecalibaculum rodentium]|jgi:hypothetical protein|uniref:ATP-binding protein n=5 Tax=Faecalibaculum rodentium TaxID=1702221 RepID=UPI0023F46765|nr:ATP-binding protein [Faecalibaculum rodentium]
MIPRELYMKQIRPFIDQDVIKVLTGVRRSGKSVLLSLIQEELKSRGVSPSQFVRFNFESFSNEKFKTAASLYEELMDRISHTDQRVYFFFDEIQEVKDWEKCINSLRVDCDCDIYITGSNAKLLAGELATYLGGRYVEIRVMPFSFGEYMTAQKQKNSRLSLSESFQNYLVFGGMPFLTNLSGQADSSLQYLKDIYNSVLLKDVIQRHNFRNTDQVERIIRYLVSNIGQPFSAASIAKYMKNEGRKISRESILEYLKACEEAFLIEKVPREDLVGKKLLTVNEKYYLTDHGFREALFGSNQRDIGQVLENIVCLELRRRGFEVHVGKAGDREVDFTASRSGRKLYIQVAYLLASPETIEREFAVLESIPDNYPKLVLSMDEIDFSRNGIIHKNIRDFLLEDVI